MCDSDPEDLCNTFECYYNCPKNILVKPNKYDSIPEDKLLEMIEFSVNQLFGKDLRIDVMLQAKITHMVDSLVKRKSNIRLLEKPD